MLWKGIICLLIVLVGFVLFLYGANYYAVTIGWVGFGLFIGGIALYVILRLLGPKQREQARAEG